MYFEHSDALWEQFPALAPGVLLVEHVRPDVAVADRLEPLFERARERLKGATESDLPAIQAWRRAFSQMGFKPTQYRSASEALLRRFRKEDTLPTLHPLVDLCNAASIAYALPVAVIDLDQMSHWIQVRHADGDERYLAFSGEEEHPEPGEVIYADGARQAHARRWTFRQSRPSTVSPATRTALVVSEGLHEGAAADVSDLLDALEREFAAVDFASSQRAMLSRATPRWTRS